MTAEPLRHVLEATGYLSDGEPAPGVLLGQAARENRRGRDFAPDASWRGQSALTVYFKYEDITPNEEVVSSWRREVWNEGFAPLLWVVSPDRVDLYNGFGRPQEKGDAAKHRLRTFRHLDKKLNELDALAGRLAMETGQFWQKVPKVNRKTSVDRQLLSDLATLERYLVKAKLDRPVAQALIGQSIFTQYLVDRQIIDSNRLLEVCGGQELPSILREPDATRRLFAWLSETFNGDMFPESSAETVATTEHLARVADFLAAVDPKTGQMTLFPYQFDVIPVELISLIYEQFAHATTPTENSKNSKEASQLGVYFTPLPVVSLALDEVMDGLTGKETVLDLTCGSGVFLVEALRRLVRLRSRGRKPSRSLIRSTLYEQIFGVDIKKSAVQVAAFSLYLAALEIDPDPQPPEALGFEPLIGRTLFVGDARTIETTSQGAVLKESDGALKTFDLIVGNPPWTFKGSVGTAERRQLRVGPTQPRGESLDFVQRALEFSHDKTRFGMILSAPPFFSASKTGGKAALDVIRRLSPVTLVNLANLRAWLFPAAKMPAVALFARHRPQPDGQITVVRVPWSPAGPKAHTFEIAPSDIINIQLAEWEKQPLWLKTAALGRRRDLVLLDRLLDEHDGLAERLRAFDAKLSVGLTSGQSDRDASSLADLELLAAGDLRPFRVPTKLPLLGQQGAERPRSRDTYRSPLLLVKEFFVGKPRLITAVAERDLVFTKAYYGAPFPDQYREAAHLLAAILSSALASWFFVMSASEFGVWKRRLLRQDVALLPIPDLKDAIHSLSGRRILSLEKKLQRKVPTHEDWTDLDETVFDLYRLDDADRVVVRDGFFRATWEWNAGLLRSVQPAEATGDLLPYAHTFLATLDAWFSARNQRHLRAEVFDLPPSDPLRVVRFVLEDGPGPSEATVHQPDADLSELLTRIGQRLNVKLANALIGQRELRVHGRNEVVMIKPAGRRHWMGVCALEDADAVITESVAGVST